jgi:hypothetical protein
MATATKKPQPQEYAANSGIGQRLLELQRLTLEAERVKDALNEQKAYLLAHAIRQNYPSLRCGAILASRRGSKSWTYSAKVTAMEAKLKALKEKEQASGTATFVESESLLVNISGKAALQQVAALEALAERTPSATRQEVPA